MSHEQLHLFIDGTRIHAAERDTRPVFDPATAEEIGRLPIATRADLDAALAAAERAFPAWSRTTAVERGRILRRAGELLRERADHIARLITREEGITLPYAKGEVLWAADILDWTAEEARRAYGRVIPPSIAGMRQTVYRVPIGPVVALTPWNAPVLMPARTTGEALAAGCTVILKAAEETPASGLEVVRAFEDAGLPKGVLNAVFGVPAEISPHLIASPVIRKVSFTGSVEVGRQLGTLAGAQGKPITLELGGHAPVIVFDDAEIDGAIAATVMVKTWNAGQLCGAPTRYLVHERVHDEFLRRLGERMAAVKVGDGMAPDSQMGPLANPRRVAAMEALVADAAARGARIATGGRRPAGLGGFFYEPTVVSQVTRDCQIMNREPFGPICAVTPFASTEEAVAEANRLGYGLAAYVFTRSAKHANDVVDALEVGSIGLNTCAVVSPETPWGGVKDSGHGAEGGMEGLASYLVTKYVASVAL